MLFEILLFISIGFSLRVFLAILNILPEKIDFIRDRINYLVFYFIIPLICFKSTYVTSFNFNHFRISAVAALTILSCLVVSWFVYKNIGMKRGINREVIGSLIICSAFGNVLYLGLPILTRLYGEIGMSYALTYDFLASTPLTWTVAVAVCMKYGRAKSLKIKDSILTIIKIPAIWGLILGVFLRKVNVQISENLVWIIEWLSQFTTIFMIMIVGLSIKPIFPKGLTIALPAVVIKLIVSPIFALFFGSLLGLNEPELNVCVIDASMPSMLLSMIFATIFGIDLRTSVEMIFITTFLFFVLSGFISMFFKFLNFLL